MDFTMNGGVSSCPPAAVSSTHNDDAGAAGGATTTTRRSTWRRRRSQRGKPRFTLAKHPTRRAMLAMRRAAQRAIAAAEKAARRKTQRAVAAAARAARRKQKAAESVARREQKAAMREQKAAAAAANQKKRKAAAAVRAAARRKLDFDGEQQQIMPPERIYRQTSSSSRADLMDNMRLLLVALDLQAGEIDAEPPVSPPEQPCTPPARSDWQILRLPPPATVTTAIVALKNKPKKATTVNKLALVPYKPKRAAASAADEVLPGALVLYGDGEPTTQPARVFVPRWTSVRLVLDKLPPRFGLVVGLDAATRAVYNELVRREETSYGDDEFHDVPGGPEWDERRREFERKVDHFMYNMRSIIGDRNFSPWGGSVVTSVVGTFLTQNVSDNLSSNAFMTIAARFPLKNRRNAAHASDNVPLLLADGHDEQEQCHCQLQSIAPCSSGSYSGDVSQQAEQTECPDKDLEAIMSAIRSGDISNFDDDHIQKVLKIRFKDSTPPPSECSSSKKKTISTAETIFKDIKSIKKNDTSHWHSLYDEARSRGYIRDDDIPDMVDWEALMNAPFADVVDCIKDRGQHSQMAFRILAFLIRMKRDHGNIDLEWLRFIPRAKAKQYLHSVIGLGHKSVDCIRLLSLRHRAFPVDTNIAHIVTRLGWVPLRPLPSSQEFHRVDNYPVMADIQMYLDPLMCNISSAKQYELHCQMITFGKAICRKSKPNCGACPFTSECKYYKSQFGRAALALPEYSQQDATKDANMDDPAKIYDLIFKAHQYQIEYGKNTERNYCEPVIEIPPTPLHENRGEKSDEDDENEYYFDDDMEDIGRHDYDMENIEHDYDMEVDLRSAKPTTNTNQAGATPGKEMIPINPRDKSTPMVKKFSLRTEYTACIIPDGHIILKKFDPRVPGDRNPYLLVFRSFDEHTVKATILIPSRTANRGMFPLNGTYFQENEVFADHSSCRSPIQINRDLVWELQRQTCIVHFGTRVHSVTKGQTREGLYHFYNEGYICTREFDRRTKFPKQLCVEIHATNVNKDIGKKRATTRFYSEEDSGDELSDW
ncbi:protein ROS1C-like [Oryza glaberrima]|uniref:protein ROS1C-like n=1 Tax=Oryza glaberrima TaxID=4538 RepID=UPI00224C5C9F|nr:protein ROS1C-like [Oryza glaberrima]